MAERHENVTRTRREIMANNFIGGISWAVGATLGVALFIFLLGLLGKYINLVPIIGDFVSEVIKYILLRNATLT